MRRALFVFATTFALCVGAYTRAVDNSLASASGRGGVPACADSTQRPAASWLEMFEKEGKPCDKECGVSGMALIEVTADGRTKLLVVHDGGDARGVEKRLGVVTIDPRTAGRVNYEPIRWPPGSTPPGDLEAVTSVPDQPGLFLAVTSAGQVFPLTVSGTSVTPRLPFPLPEYRGQGQIEGLSVQKLKGRLVIAWGYRRAGAQGGILYYALLHLEKSDPEDKFEAPGHTFIKVQCPSPENEHKRHIADLKIDEQGDVWATATYDPGRNDQGQDIGPFKTAVYKLGVLDASQTSISFKRYESLPPVATFEKKVEGIELLPGPDGVFIFGAEDEDNGGRLLKWSRKAGRGELSKSQAAPH